MQELVLIQDLALVMVVSAITLIICYRLHLPVVLGYILAGFLIGPHTPPYSLVSDPHSIEILSALGVIFLLFAIGLEFSFSKLAKVGAVAFMAATVEIIFMLALGFMIGKMMGWDRMDSLFLGAILSISSTTIIAKILIEYKLVKEKFAQIILGILIIEDLWAIVMIAILSGIATTGSLTLSEIAISMIKVFGFITVVIFAGLWAVPKLLRAVEKLGVSEVMVITVLGLCFGVSLIAAKTGFSIALGAFLIGAVIAETQQAHSIVEKMEPIRDMFTAIFFVSVGMLIDPAVITQYALPILIITIATILGKIFICSLATFVAGHNSKISLRVGLGLAQIGEFSFIIAQLGRDTNVTGNYLYPIAVSVSAITTISTPFLMNNADKIIDAMKRVIPLPMVTLFNLYPSWLGKLRTTEISSRRKLLMVRDIRVHLPKNLFYGMSIMVIYLIANHFADAFPNTADVYWAIVSVIILPFFIGFAFSLDKLVWEGIILNILNTKAVSKSKEAGEMLHNIIRFIIIVFAGLIFITFASRLVPGFPLGLSVIVLLIASGAFLMRSVMRVHEKVEGAIMSIFDFEKPLDQAKTRSTHDQMVDLIRSNYPLSFETQDFMLPFQESGVNQTIRELALRTQTGATIVALYREEDVITNPPADIKLMPGDVLLLIGEEEQIKYAVGYLQAKIKEPLKD